ncbi:arginase family protein [Microbulbifer marinus]|uniref:Agmatinase n=1 Tax=Microbulbifer marinus TaxID=658218 RepID=A0A1H3W0S9_9GAMM|nr:arginase family protein [Microbulbifer marinus]SDZ80656.1 agmatinase [Microbulbifer marinus]
MSEFNQPIDSSRFSRESQVATMMRNVLAGPEQYDELEIGLWGCPFDLGLGARNGVRMGPAAIREASRYIRKVNPTTAINPYKLANIADIGDPEMNMMIQSQALEDIEKFVAEFTGKDIAPICAGGDHTIPLPILRGMKKGGYIDGGISVLHIDAHADTLDTLGDEKICNATPFRRAVEEGLIDPSKSIQVGLRGTRFAEDDIQGSYDLGYNVITMDEYEEMGRAAVIDRIKQAIGNNPCYITIDVDGLDPICCPGTGAPEPGGIMMRDMQMILRNIRQLDVIGGDVCEVMPHRDPTGMTQLNAANLIFEITCLAAENIARKKGRI